MSRETVKWKTTVRWTTVGNPLCSYSTVRWWSLQLDANVGPEGHSRNVSHAWITKTQLCVYERERERERDCGLLMCFSQEAPSPLTSHDPIWSGQDFDRTPKRKVSCTKGGKKKAWLCVRSMCM